MSFLAILIVVIAGYSIAKTKNVDINRKYLLFICIFIDTQLLKFF